MGWGRGGEGGGRREKGQREGGMEGMRGGEIGREGGRNRPKRELVCQY